jgi:hypothetical protein
MQTCTHTSVSAHEREIQTHKTTEYAEGRWTQMGVSFLEGLELPFNMVISLGFQVPAPFFPPHKRHINPDIILSGSLDTDEKSLSRLNQ